MVSLSFCVGTMPAFLCALLGNEVTLTSFNLFGDTLTSLGVQLCFVTVSLKIKKFFKIYECLINTRLRKSDLRLFGHE